jgi:hypothetical protein
VLGAVKELIADLPGVKLVLNGWQSWPRFRKIVGHMHLLLQPSYTESFNMVTADGVVEGVPFCRLRSHRLGATLLESGRRRFTRHGPNRSSSFIRSARRSRWTTRSQPVRGGRRQPLPGVPGRYSISMQSPYE